jgi:hypothetical protein
MERVMRKTTTAISGRSALVADLANVVRAFRSLFDPYRPELHYMRGPGPKWHAKHAAPSATAHPVPGLLSANV